MSDISELEDIIGYRFKNRDFLIMALRHSTYTHEKHMPPHKSNERLEFLGDAVLELVSSELLYHRFPKESEGDLSKWRASLVSESPLAACARAISLGRFLMLGKGEEHTRGRQRASVLSDALEALIGAIYLDTGMESAKSFILGHVLTDIEHQKRFRDSKTALQELTQAKYRIIPQYRMISAKGPDHNMVYEYEVWVSDECVGHGKGHSKKSAEQAAAYEALKRLSE